MAAPNPIGLTAGLHSEQAGVLDAADLDTPVAQGLTGVVVSPVLDSVTGTGRSNVIPSWEQSVVGRLSELFGALTWWERIHVTPFSRDFGFHLSTQQISVYVWNASRLVARISSDYEVTGEDGVSLVSPPNFPLHFPAGDEVEFTVEVSEDGAPDFLNNVVFRFPNFTDGETDAVLFGTRVVPWPIDPSGFITEGYGYLTRIIRSMSDAEQRAALKREPVRTWTFDFVLVGRDSRVAQALLYGWSARPFGLPMWYEETVLDAAVSAGETVLPADVDLRDWDQFALLWQNPWTYEAVLIEDVTSNGLELGTSLLADWPAGTRLYPVRLARIDARSQLSYRSLESATYRVTFRAESWRNT